MHADFRLLLGNLAALLAVLSSAQAFYIPGELMPYPSAKVHSAVSFFLLTSLGQDGQSEATSKTKPSPYMLIKSTLIIHNCNMLTTIFLLFVRRPVRNMLGMPVDEEPRSTWERCFEEIESWPQTMILQWDKTMNVKFSAVIQPAEKA